MPKNPVIRELLWLLLILLVALPLAGGLSELIDHFPDLNAALDQLLPAPELRAALLYVLTVLGCYLVRLGAYVAGRVARLELAE